MIVKDGLVKVFHEVDDASKDAVLKTHIIYQYFEHNSTKQNPDYKLLSPHFAYMPEDIIKKTFKATTQYAKTTVSTILKRHFKSPFPALNIPRRN